MWKKPNSKLDFLRNNPIFHDLSKKEAEYVKEKGEQKTLSPGDFLLKNQPIKATLSIIIKGKMEIKGESGEILAVLQENDFFGEHSLFLEETEPITLVAKEKTDLFMFSNELLDEIMETKPATATKILLNISAILGKRLRATNNELEQIKK